MISVEFEGINSMMVGLSKLMIKDALPRNTRGEICKELPYPIIIKLRNPQARYVTISCRKWNVFLAYAESLLIASGRNDLEFIGRYLKKMKDFSDDGKYLRGGYGPRYRNYNSNTNDYKIGETSNNNFERVDQLDFIIKKLSKDKYSRQAIITFCDPIKDFFENNNLKTTKDFPCTCLLHFMVDVKTNKLNLTTYMRSNDIIWGASAVNIFNYTFIQEYVANILNLEIGCYYHIANNLHYYVNRHSELIQELANIENVKDLSFDYDDSIESLQNFDNSISKMIFWENELAKGNTSEILTLNNDFFDDWSKVIYHKYFNNKSLIFKNPILNSLLK